MIVFADKKMVNSQYETGFNNSQTRFDRRIQQLYGLETKHPLVTVIDLTQATNVVNHVSMDYDVYALFLKNGTNCTLNTEDSLTTIRKVR